MHIIKHIILGLGIIGTFFSVAYAGTTTTTTKTTATLVSTCSMSAIALSFGDLTPSGSILTMGTGQSSLNITCSKQLSYTISLSLGSNGTTGRYMKGATKGQLINYAICQSPGFSGTILAGNWNCNEGYWSNLNSDTAHVLVNTGTGQPQTFSMYGLAIKDFYTPDNYSDTVVATLIY